MSQDEAATTWSPLTARERRVAGVLVEKQKTTPENYPLSLAALVTGCNQKSNRDPVTNYDADDVEDILQGLRKKGAAVMVEGGGRVVRWKHTLYDWLGLRGHAVEMAVLAELMLRGPQTEGDLRARASRMDPIPDLGALQKVLEGLAERGLVVFLTPPGVRRGVVVTHGLYPPEELEKVRKAQALVIPPDDESPRQPSSPRPDTTGELAMLRADVQALQEQVNALAAEVKALKEQLGA